MKRILPENGDEEREMGSKWFVSLCVHTWYPSSEKAKTSNL